MERNKQGRLESRHLKSFPEKLEHSIHFQLAGEQKQRNKFAFLPFFTHPHDAKSKVKRETRGNLLSQVATTTSECIFQAGRWKQGRPAPNFCLCCSKLNLFAQHVLRVPQLISFRRHARPLSAGALDFSRRIVGQTSATLNGVMVKMRVAVLNWSFNCEK